MSTEVTNAELRAAASQEYQYGWVTDVEADTAPPGLSEDLVRWISAKKNEPPFMLEWRLRAFRHFMTLMDKDQRPTWAHVDFAPIDFQEIIYYSAPRPKLESLEQVDEEV
ncbi:MAG: Fe-S cluster assembly protein SufB, partial [Candidatus Brocadiia bacterium]|nr:Fe-S cluster assembly protein SufB [Candidatus Brocadiia bacterium]